MIKTKTDAKTLFM